jgi:hypothetical protein
MAIRNDFAPGEVLAAADLNDTFGSKLTYPSGGADGNVLTKSGTAAAWSAADAPGSVLITSESFSAVSAVNVNGCFTSTYANYSILIEISASSANANLQARMRASGTDNTSSNYERRAYVGGATFDNVNATGENLFQLSYSATPGAWMIHLYGPQLTRLTRGHLLALTDQDSRVIMQAIRHNVSSAFDGISFIAASGNITGTLRVYGHRN